MKGIRDMGKMTQKIWSLGLGALVAVGAAHATLDYKVTTLVPPGSVDVTVVGINASGRIVGNFVDVGGHSHAYTVLDGVYTDIATLLSPAVPVDTYIISISDSGHILGNYIPASGHSQAFELTIRDAVPSVPPPAPVLKVKGRLSLKTSSATFFITGTATGNVATVTYQIGKKSSQSALGTSSWGFNTKLKSGRNVIKVTAHGPGGDSNIVKLTIVRSKS